MASNFIRKGRKSSLFIVSLIGYIGEYQHIHNCPKLSSQMQDLTSLLVSVLAPQVPGISLLKSLVLVQLPFVGSQIFAHYLQYFQFLEVCLCCISCPDFHISTIFVPILP